MRRPRPDPEQLDQTRCPVCNETFAYMWGQDKWTMYGGCDPVWDHCHKCGEFRGWVCRGCNWMLGFLERDRGAVSGRAGWRPRRVRKRYEDERWKRAALEYLGLHVCGKPKEG